MFNIILSFSFAFLLSLTTFISYVHSGSCLSRMKVHPSDVPEVGEVHLRRSSGPGTTLPRIVSLVDLVAREDEQALRDTRASSSSQNDSDDPESIISNASSSDGSSSVEYILNNHSQELVPTGLLQRPQLFTNPHIERVMAQHRKANTKGVLRTKWRVASSSPHHSPSMEEITSLRAPPSTVRLETLPEDLRIIYDMLQGFTPHASPLVLYLVRKVVAPDDQVGFSQYFSKYTHKYGNIRTADIFKVLFDTAQKMQKTEHFLQFLLCLDEFKDTLITFMSSEDELYLLQQAINMIPSGFDVLSLIGKINQLFINADVSPLSMLTFLRYMQIFISDALDGNNLHQE